MGWPLDEVGEASGAAVASEGEGGSHALHGFVNGGAALVLGAVRYLSGDDSATQAALGPVVGRFDFRPFEKEKHSAAIVLSGPPH